MDKRLFAAYPITEETWTGGLTVQVDFQGE